MYTVNARVRSSDSKASALLLKAHVLMNLAIQIHKSQLDKGHLVFYPLLPHLFNHLPAFSPPHSLLTTKGDLNLDACIFHSEHVVSVID